MQEVAEGIREFLKIQAELIGKTSKTNWPYKSIAEFLVKHGQVYTWEPLAIKPLLSERVPQYCFENAYLLAKRKKWWYVEGYALGSVIPVHHAWVVDPARSTVVIDPTWKDEEAAYFGVAFNIALVGRVRRRSSTVLDDWHKNWPLLSGKIKNWWP